MTRPAAMRSRSGSPPGAVPFQFWRSGWPRPGRCGSLKDERKDTAGEPPIRAATAADVPVIGQIVEQAYRHYIPRIGKPPGPMLDNYDARVSEGVVWVIGEPPSIVGIVVLLPRPEYLLLDNI